MQATQKFEENDSMQIDEIVVSIPNPTNPIPIPNPNQSQNSQNNDISDDDILKEMSDRYKSDI